MIARVTVCAFLPAVEVALLPCTCDRQACAQFALFSMPTSMPHALKSHCTRTTLHKRHRVDIAEDVARMNDIVLSAGPRKTAMLLLGGGACATCLLSTPQARNQLDCCHVTPRCHSHLPVSTPTRMALHIMNRRAQAPHLQRQPDAQRRRLRGVPEHRAGV